ncbi:MAG: polysaccharide biosynthesis/export family protein [Thermodesulfobacteriota bacterium]|nr:polysaccharide biosynthesis/export family protein [Thermodesulfobacteriota bacterium]
MKKTENHTKRLYSFIIYIFIILSFILPISSCVSYPDIPDVKKTSEDKKNNFDLNKNEETIAEVFEKKAGEFFHPYQSDKAKDYQIGPEDILLIQVWDHDDLTRSVTVSREGEFSYPLIGMLSADGMTVHELKKDLEEKLAGRFIINPQVTVSVKEYKSKRVYLLGEVGGPYRGDQGPGVYPLTGQTTLLEVISRAGGPTRDAGNEIVVVRPRNNIRKGNPVPLENAGEGEVITLNLRKSLEGDTNQNIILKHGDTIYVPKAEFFYVYGEVKSEGRYKLEKGTTVLKGITMAGGFTEKAAKKKVRLLREKKGEKAKIQARMTDLINPEDIIMVPESFF